MTRQYLPYFIFKRLFGDRKTYGLQIDELDKDWIEWQKNYLKFYTDNQKGSIGHQVNHFGFKISESVDIDDKVVLEIGPGIIEHLDYNQQKPKKYILADIDPQFLKKSKKVLEQKYHISNVECIIVSRNKLPIPSHTIDVLFTFHQLEHVYQLDAYLKELKRVLKPNGLLVGAVPCEGGLAWGLGRYLTSRKYVQKHMNFNYDKIICWEHPNFIDYIHQQLSSQFTPIQTVKRPFPILPFDCNLSWSFIYQNNQ